MGRHARIRERERDLPAVALKFLIGPPQDGPDQVSGLCSASLRLRCVGCQSRHNLIPIGHVVHLIKPILAARFSARRVTRGTCAALSTLVPMRSARLALLTTVPLVLALSACAPSGWFDAVGSVTVPTGADARYVGLPCDDFRGVDDAPIDGDFSDIGEGTQIVIEDQSGETIALGALEAGTLVDGGGDTLLCSYPFTLTKVPETAFYSILVGDGSRGGVQFTQEQMQNGPAIALQ